MVNQIVVYIRLVHMVVDPLLALIDLLFDTFEKHGFVSVCDIM